MRETMNKNGLIDSFQIMKTPTNSCDTVKRHNTLLSIYYKTLSMVVLKRILKYSDIRLLFRYLNVFFGIRLFI